MIFKKILELGFSNILLFEEQYEKFLKDPNSVDITWRTLLEGLDEIPSKSNKKELIKTEPLPIKKEELPAHPPIEEEKRPPSDIRVYHLIEAHRTYGHLMAHINPIATHPPTEPEELKLKTYGLDYQDLPKRFPTYGLLKEPFAPLIQIVNALKSIYCQNIGVEYIGLGQPELEKWLQNYLEDPRGKINIPLDQKQMILHHLNKSELFEVFLHTKYVGQKRFSLEGTETLIPMLSALIEKGASLGVEAFQIGMAHRGRLNVLSNILNKSYIEIFSEFDEAYIPDSYEGTGDVKYHKGYTSEYKTQGSQIVKVDLIPNPSHLEAVDPVLEGQTRAKQELIKDEKREKILPILIHGDAALSGQGVVYETLQLCKLEGYTTGGTLHFVINNQIGFTTLPKDSRSTLYCTDIAKAFGAPVFHVNAEDPEGCVLMTLLALEIRQRFHCDVFIDLNGYRKYGHNEMDEPAFTQPLEYQMIRQKKPIRELYRDQLIHQGVLEKYMAQTMEEDFKKTLQQALSGTKISEKSKEIKLVEENKKHSSGAFETFVPKKNLQEIAQHLFSLPPNFNIHSKLVHLTKERLAMISDDLDPKPIDWGMGESLAYASLLWEGIHIRLSGQDCCRGTFSHRHAVLMDQKEENSYFPLKNLRKEQGKFDIYNSPLSEYAVMGYELGYTLGNPAALVIWEAQFGDFANGAQSVIDQFLVSGEQKWAQKTGLVLYLPHGYEGQGPDHSTGRIERFLQLAGHENIRVTNPTTPGQLFHLLRRQAYHPLRKPLVIFTPKGLLRHPNCVSSITDFTQGSFKEILDDSISPPSVKKLLFCSGRVYYDLIGERAKVNSTDVAFVRLEQLYPLEKKKLEDLLKKYQGFEECFWVQEEPANMGAWDYIRPLLQSLLPQGKELKYIGRSRSATTAAGSLALHKREYQEIMTAIFKNYEIRVPHDEAKFKS